MVCETVVLYIFKIFTLAKHALCFLLCVAIIVVVSRVLPDANAFAAALKPFDLVIAPRREAVRDLSAAPAAEAYLCRNNDHWFGLRRIGAHWLNLNHAMQRPAQLSAEHLGVCLSQLEDDGHEIYVVQGDLPACDADSDPLFLTYFDWGLVGGLFLSSRVQLENDDQWDVEILDEDIYFDDEDVAEGYNRGMYKYPQDDQHDDGSSYHGSGTRPTYAGSASASAAAAASSSSSSALSRSKGVYDDSNHQQAPACSADTAGDDICRSRAPIWKPKREQYERVMPVSTNLRYEDDLEAAIMASLEDQASGTSIDDAKETHHGPQENDEQSESGYYSSPPSSSLSWPKRTRDDCYQHSEEDDQLAAAMSSRLYADLSHPKYSKEGASQEVRDEEENVMPSTRIRRKDNESGELHAPRQRRSVQAARDDTLTDMQQKSGSLLRHENELLS